MTFIAWKSQVWGLSRRSTILGAKALFQPKKIPRMRRKFTYKHMRQSVYTQPTHSGRSAIRSRGRMTCLPPSSPVHQDLCVGPLLQEPELQDCRLRAGGPLGSWAWPRAGAMRQIQFGGLSWRLGAYKSPLRKQGKKPAPAWRISVYGLLWALPQKWMGPLLELKAGTPADAGTTPCSQQHCSQEPQGGDSPNVHQQMSGLTN